jgi:ppGpp synthetase/RelA/SpoT-type nucleotidyltranferase
MSLEVQQEVDRFFADPKHRKAYEALLAEMEADCKAIQAALPAGIVRAVYSRRDKQSDDPFKSQPKIVRALAAKRTENKTAPVSAVEDIIGLTVVVYYPDQIGLVRARLLVRLDGRFNFEKDRALSRGGYHAHHIVAISNDPDHADLRCEVQIKTMMHDAWAAKMHDLNYKPQGQTDDRLATMMQVLGDALQATEEQSVLLRNLIHERWNAELNRRQAVRRTCSASCR